MQLERIECNGWKKRSQFHQSLEEYAWIVLLISLCRRQWMLEGMNRVNRLSSLRHNEMTFKLYYQSFLLL
jgi:hypothetical protein